MVCVVRPAVCARVVAMQTVVAHPVAVAAAGMGMVMSAAMRCPRRRPARRRGIGVGAAERLPSRGPCRSSRPGRGRTRDPGDRRAAQRDRHPATHGGPLPGEWIGGIGDGVVCGRGHHRLHGNGVDHAGGVAGEAAADEHPRQHRTDRREDAWNDPLTPEHARCIPAVQSLNRAIFTASPCRARSRSPHSDSGLPASGSRRSGSCGQSPRQGTGGPRSGRQCRARPRR